MAGQIRRLLATRSEVATQEERRRLQRDLHDGIKQELFAASMQLAAAQAALSDNDGALAAALTQAAGSCRKAQQELAVLLGEGATLLDGLPLNGALEELGAELEKACGVRVTSELACRLEIAGTAEEALYRVAQEAFTNIRRHARASTVTVQLACTDGQAWLEIRDDGCGFDASSVAAGMGLKTMRERLELLGGELSLESSSSGTCVTAVLPVTEGP
jgi:signal transduction histidine kinase